MLSHRESNPISVSNSGPPLSLFTGSQTPFRIRLRLLSKSSSCPNLLESLSECHVSNVMPKVVPITPAMNPETSKLINFTVFSTVSAFQCSATKRSKNGQECVEKYADNITLHFVFSPPASAGILAGAHFAALADSGSLVQNCISTALICFNLLVLPYASFFVYSLTCLG
ncbi:hypothetical protein V6N11_043212 [Hibiscus sabdariffa]|uniref:Uncharacterized protein n=1 Tax=Hibiscus sabdariffa TaxID=183260 RepID=A0ABR2QYJ6_9ROSI